MENLKSNLIGVFLTGALMLFTFNGFAQDGSQTVKGEVLDMTCYMTSGAKGQGHKKCAKDCLDRGLPAGILDEDGNVYLLVENHDKQDAYAEAIKHAAEDVEISGEVVDKKGMKALVVDNVNVEG